MSEILRGLVSKLRDGGWNLLAPQDMADMIADELQAALDAPLAQGDRAEGCKRFTEVE